MITTERKRIQAFKFTDAASGQTLIWSVSKALEILRARAERGTIEILILPLWNVRNLIQSNGLRDDIDDNHALTRDLADPIIIIPSPFIAGTCIVIDGWHRLRKADLTDASEVYGVMLTEEEEEACRL